jgi:hypothetical protein
MKSPSPRRARENETRRIYVTEIVVPSVTGKQCKECDYCKVNEGNGGWCECQEACAITVQMTLGGPIPQDFAGNK